MVRKLVLPGALALVLGACATAVLPPVQKAEARTQTGKASWYGPGFHGRKTASGERFNQNAHTAAHRTYAFGTRICVKNLNNGRGTTVRVNDRGPFVGGRIVDVSKAAAGSIGMIRSGTAPVSVTVVAQDRKTGSKC